MKYLGPKTSDTDVATQVDFEDALVVVNHGGTASTARPNVNYVMWIGTVSPDNAQNKDVLIIHN